MQRESATGIFFDVVEFPSLMNPFETNYGCKIINQMPKKYLPEDSKMLKLKEQFPDIYEWMLEKMPFGCMYVRRHIDSQHKMVFPRWGWTKRQHTEAQKRAKEIMKNLKWE